MTTKPRLTLALVGDVMLGGRALEALRRMGVAAMARLIWAPLEGADVVVANLEAPITDAAQVREDKRSNFRTSPEILGLFDSRFVLGLANNHILDYGKRGLVETIEALDECGIPHVGAGRNLKEAGQPALVDVDGLRLAVLSAADARWQAASEASAGVFPARPGLLRERVRNAQDCADEVVVSIHAGMEFMPVPSPMQLKLADMCLEEGVRVVSFHHTHCIGGVQQERRGVVFFATGNYVFPKTLGAPYPAWSRGAAWRVDLPTSRQEMPRVEVRPVLLNEDGLPEEATVEQAEEILRRVEQLSWRLQRRGRLSWWRLSQMARPEYVRLNLVNYADIAQRQGIRRMLQAIWGGAQAQLR
jgi:poly-gamma-glutamate synthesis protein (capsule biosynthesis protein)